MERQVHVLSDHPGFRELIETYIHQTAHLAIIRVKRSYQTCYVRQAIIRVTGLTKHVTFARQSFVSQVLAKMLRSPGNHSCHRSYQT